MPVSQGGETMAAALPRRVRDVLSKGGGSLFLSPHLDDAVLSCAALMSALATTGRVTAVTVYSSAGPPPYTRAARSFLRSSGAPDADELYERRRAEDRAALDLLGVEHVHLGLPDALFRRRRHAALGLAAGRVLPELIHRYPTYRYDIARGRVARADRSQDLAAAKVRELLAARAPQLVFCPIGVGRHVDHLLVRSLGLTVVPDPVFFEDFPYLLNAAADQDFVREHRLQRWAWTQGSSRKRRAITAYRSQVPGLFPQGRVPEVPEIYYTSSEAGG